MALLSVSTFGYPLHCRIDKQGKRESLQFKCYLQKPIPMCSRQQIIGKRNCRIRYLKITWRNNGIPCAQTNDTVFLSEETMTALKRKVQELANNLMLPPNFLAQLPGDLRRDLNDAAFDLSNGPLREECGEKIGEILMELSQAWEKADTDATVTIARSLPSLLTNLSENERFAIGTRFKCAGKRFASMGQYGQGELSRIAKSFSETGEALTEGYSKGDTLEKPLDKTRTLKFGTLQVKLTSRKAYIGSVFALLFGSILFQHSFMATCCSSPEYTRVIPAVCK
eukprot:TRINITY_DN8230_c0_g1_i1.p1 TRINITY_DN8230_c0_g1~~TRINITY_DN8230_c0_g1_i1.p1  ORF type:complete len:282 (-),score=47.15 TRINITY_DN8230_c0_g1_i1:473-1318(-)